jgi:chromosome segregation ATPase
MLIGRIRQREENEIAAANIQRRMETQILELKDENRDLHHRLETGHVQLQKKEMELKKYQARLEDWKLKIRKFKLVVDELGHDHDVLKEDNDQFKVTAASLGKEKSELFQAIDDAKLHIARAEGRADEQRKEIADKEQRIALLQQALTAAQDQDECTKAELISERNRNATLESYIQNHALTQAKQIVLIKDDQTKLIQDLKAGLESITTNATTSKDDILSGTKSIFDQCRTSIEILSEKCSDEKLEVQEFTACTRDVISQ